MICTYILKSIKDGKSYIGSTNNLERRLIEHQNGLVNATKHRRPIILYGYRTFKTVEEASLWEKKYKRSHGQLERDIRRNIVILS